MEKTQLEFNLKEGLNNPEKAEEIVADVQKSFDELTDANSKLLAQVKKTVTIAEDYQKHAETLAQSNMDLVEALKNVHTVLGSKKDLWKDDEEMNNLQNIISTFILSSGAIKAGVVNNAKFDE